MPHWNTTNAVNATRNPTQCPMIKRYKHSKRLKNDQPERLVNATNALNATKVQPKHSINNTNAVNVTKLQPQCPLNMTNAVNATRVPPQCPINATNTLNATKQKGRMERWGGGGTLKITAFNCFSLTQPPQSPLNLILLAMTKQQRSMWVVNFPQTPLQANNACPEES